LIGDSSVLEISRLIAEVKEKDDVRILPGARRSPSSL
jgi:hypothetical protein